MAAWYQAGASDTAVSAGGRGDCAGVPSLNTGGMRRDRAILITRYDRWPRTRPPGTKMASMYGPSCTARWPVAAAGRWPRPRRVHGGQPQRRMGATAMCTGSAHHHEFGRLRGANRHHIEHSVGEGPRGPPQSAPPPAEPPLPPLLLPPPSSSLRGDWRWTPLIVAMIAVAPER